MALTKVNAKGINVADDFAFTGTVSGAGKLKNIVYVPINPFTLTGGTVQFPKDNTIPLIAEGARVIQHTYEPIATTSTVYAQPSGNGGFANMHLQASFSNSNGNDIDIEVRADNVANYYTINGQDLNESQGHYTIGTSAFGGANATSATYITITEF